MTRQGQGGLTMAASEFVSEPIVPDAGRFDTSSMSAGRPGLPEGFTWRGRHYAIREILDEWKVSEAEHHRSGERYYRKHFWRVRVDSGEMMTLYAVRHVKTGESPRKRWWMYTIDSHARSPRGSTSG
jgi:hypothetical protein